MEFVRKGIYTYSDGFWGINNNALPIEMVISDRIPNEAILIRLLCGTLKLNSDLIENAVIVIDEFDATKDTIQSELIDKSLAMQEDYIQLFRQIYRTLNPNDFSSSMRQGKFSRYKEDCSGTYNKR